VREYALFQRFTFSVTDAKGVVIPPTAITLRRVITYDENQELAKQAEEALLYRDMQSDLVQQILRRLAASKSAISTRRRRQSDS
jgi:LPS-assembly lipoprotein